METSSRNRTFLVLLVVVIPLSLSACRKASAIQAADSSQQRGEVDDEKEKKEPASARALPVRVVRRGGSRLDWCAGTNLLAFDVLGKDGYFDVHTMKPDGAEDRCVSCDVPGLPRRHVGQPAWHPSCRYLVVQAEKQEHIKIRFSPALRPGAGVLNDLWLIDLEKEEAHPLYQVKDERGQGTLHSHFSDDGRKLSWSEMLDKGGFKKGKELGYWKLMTADFDMVGGKPALSNLRSFTPGGDGFYENHGFSPDGEKLSYSSTTDSKRFINNIYVLDLASGRATQLTDSGYNEHAIFSPDGKRIVWISTTGNKGGTDYWLMNADGSGKRRLTFFNQKGHPHYAGRRVVVADFAWSPDGKSIAGYYRAGGAIESLEDEVQIVTVDLADELGSPAK